MPNDRKLSKLQKWILSYLWEMTTDIEENGNDSAKTDLRVWGVKWYPSTLHKTWIASDRVGTSRALRRLEERRLVIRNNDIKGVPGEGGCRMSLDQPAPKRTNYVKLTPEGRETAKRLTKNNFLNVSRFGN